MFFAEQLIELGVARHAFGERAIPEQANMVSSAQAIKEFQIKNHLRINCIFIALAQTLIVAQQVKRSTWIPSPTNPLRI
jgi:hypothetical protein